MRFSSALIASLVVHALLAAGVLAVLRVLPASEVSAHLDLSSVELSLAETEDATAEVRQFDAAAVAEPPCSKPELAAPTPTLEVPSPIPPDAAKVKLPETAPRELMTPPSAPALAAPQQARIEAMPKPKAALRPKYPAGARRRGEQGEVVLEIAVDARGQVETVAVASSSGSLELDEAAVTATKAAAFIPARAGGRAVASTARLTIAFRLNP